MDQGKRPQPAGGKAAPKIPLARALCDVTVIVSQAPEVLRALDEVLDRLLALTKAEIGAIYAADPVSGGLDLAASRGLSSAFNALECRIPKGACLCGIAAMGEEPLVVDDLAHDPRLSRTACREERLGTMVGVPLRSRGLTWGILTLYASRAGAFAAVDQELLRTIGWHLGAALDNAQWSAAMRRAAVLRERSAMAEDLHDGVAQSLAYLNIQTQRVQDLLSRGANERARAELKEARDTIDAAYQDVRRLLVESRRAHHEDERPSTALRTLLDAFRRGAGIRVELSGEGEIDRLPSPYRSDVLRMVQEALANVRKHARASRVAVTCRPTPEQWEITVADDGVGCDPARFDTPTDTHLGIALLRERAQRMRGRIQCVSRPGEGTAVTIAVPLAATSEESLR